ncbi:hypothetical protein CHL76_02375 [Marinococcus halophilus]|uniref:Adenylate kinase n=1 Tax=Marinococcus halophilus TaxID=1371 RepID=A0A510Y1H5_MARHA|nr:hypothetical protein [Marinococcus halophilus]OZT81221.1 hypothetical protein CHL76_02375 [Marinococcus halophilus]GEK57160.1 hypothetical protein MHA01_00650 [Marinococcus halophilus]
MAYENKIAICGKFRSGKNTVADIISGQYGMTQFAFSEGIWATGRLLFPEDFNGNQKPRKLLQDVGQKLREVDEDIWVRFLFNNIEASGEKDIVITDLRQPNEMKYLRENGFFIIRVGASLGTRLNRATEAGDRFTKVTAEHETESYLNDFDVDYSINNDGTLEELHEQVKDAMDKYKTEGAIQPQGEKTNGRNKQV